MMPPNLASCAVLDQDKAYLSEGTHYEPIGRAMSHRKVLAIEP